MVTLTNNEELVLLDIIQDAETSTGGDFTYSEDAYKGGYAQNFLTAKQFAGVVGSLAKKGLISCETGRNSLNGQICASGSFQYLSKDEYAAYLPGYVAAQPLEAKEEAPEVVEEVVEQAVEVEEVVEEAVEAPVDLQAAIEALQAETKALQAEAEAVRKEAELLETYKQAILAKLEAEADLVKAKVELEEAKGNLEGAGGSRLQHYFATEAPSGAFPTSKKDQNISRLLDI